MNITHEHTLSCEKCLVSEQRCFPLWQISLTSGFINEKLDNHTLIDSTHCRVELFEIHMENPVQYKLERVCEYFA